MDSVSLHGLRWSIEISVRYSIDVVQRGHVGMVTGILWELPFVFLWPIFLFLQAPGSLILSSHIVLPLFAIDLCTSYHFFCFTQGLLEILQLQVFAGFPIELVYALAFFLLELVLKRGLKEHPIHKVS